MSPTALSTIRAMDRPLSFLKIIYLAYTHLFHRGSFAFNRRIVCFRPFRSSVFKLFKFREDRPLWRGSSALTHRSSALILRSSDLTPDRLLSPKDRLLSPRIVCFHLFKDRLLWRSRIVRFRPYSFVSHFQITLGITSFHLCTRNPFKSTKVVEADMGRHEIFPSLFRIGNPRNSGDKELKLKH